MVESIGRYKFAIGALIENPKGEVLLIKRSPDNPPANIWDIVGGGIEQYEDPFAALSREIEEETGIRDFELIKALDVFCVFKGDKTADIIGTTFWCKIKSDIPIKLSHEHVEYCWIKPKKALEISTHKDVTSTILRFIEEKQKLGYS